MSFKEPLCFLGGLIVGGAIGVLAMWRRCDEQVNQAYEESRSYYNKKLAELSAKNRNKPAPAKIIKSVVKDDAEPVVVQKNPEKTDYTAYSTITKEDPVDPVPLETKPEETEEPFVLISDENYMYDHDYDKMTVVVYADGTLARDDDDDILDVDETIGAGVYNAALNSGNPYDAIYVRNKDRQIDYEVVTNDKTYTEQTGVFLGGEARD